MVLLLNASLAICCNLLYTLTCPHPVLCILVNVSSCFLVPDFLLRIGVSLLPEAVDFNWRWG